MNPIAPFDLGSAPNEGFLEPAQQCEQNADVTGKLSLELFAMMMLQGQMTSPLKVGVVKLLVSLCKSVMMSYRAQ